MASRVAIITNVLEYAGPPAADALAADGFQTLCHDAKFADPTQRAAFAASHGHKSAAGAQSPEALVAEAVATFGRLDVVVSNDAGSLMTGPIEDRSAVDYRALLEAFAVMPYRLVSAALPHLKRQGSGRLILVTSAAPLRPLPNMALYTAARAAANSMVQTLAAELGPAGLSINAIAPYMLRSSYFPRGMDSPRTARLVQDVIPMKRLGEPEEIGALIALLASGKADFISGQIIAFSGGGA